MLSLGNKLANLFKEGIPIPLKHLDLCRHYFDRSSFLEFMAILPELPSLTTLKVGPFDAQPSAPSTSLVSHTHHRSGHPHEEATPLLDTDTRDAEDLSPEEICSAFANSTCRFPKLNTLIAHNLFRSIDSLAYHAFSSDVRLPAAKEIMICAESSSTERSLLTKNLRKNIGNVSFFYSIIRQFSGLGLDTTRPSSKSKKTV